MLLALQFVGAQYPSADFHFRTMPTPTHKPNAKAHKITLKQLKLRPNTHTRTHTDTQTFKTQYINKFFMELSNTTRPNRLTTSEDDNLNPDSSHEELCTMIFNTDKIRST